MPPPPIPWNTKPNVDEPRTQDGSSLGTSQQSNVATHGLVPVYIHPDRLPDIEAALRYLGLPPLSNSGSNYNHGISHQKNLNHSISERLISPASPQPKIGRYSTQDGQDGSDLTAAFSRLSAKDGSDRAPPASFPVRPSNLNHSGRFNSPVSPQPKFGRSSTQDGQDGLDRSTSFSRLSTSDGFAQVPPASFPVRSSPVVQPQGGISPRKKTKKYYVVTVGKCTGVFWDEWNNVLPLVAQVSGARYISFSTCEEAVACYLDAKKEKLVKVVRDPGDDLLFGPFRDAMQ